jgi:hypothetical protein
MGTAAVRDLRRRHGTREVDGELRRDEVVFESWTTFVLGTNARETVVVVTEDDGAWRVSEYRVVLASQSSAAVPGAA